MCVQMKCTSRPALGHDSEMTVVSLPVTVQLLKYAWTECTHGPALGLASKMSVFLFLIHVKERRITLTMRELFLKHFHVLFECFC